MARLDRYRICIPRELSKISTQYVASQPRTSDHLACHWRALCLLAYDNWGCSVQPEVFHSLKVPSPSRDSISDRQRDSPVHYYTDCLYNTLMCSFTFIVSLDISRALYGVTMTLFRSHGRDACPISHLDVESHTSAGN